MSASLFFGALANPLAKERFPPLGRRASCRSPGREGFQPSKLSPGQDGLRRRLDTLARRNSRVRQFLASLKYSLPLDSPRSHKL